MSKKVKNSLSSFAQFHIMFMGYKFQDIETGIVIEKYKLWYKHRETCLRMILNQKPSPRFKLIDKEGWRDGNIIKRRKKK